MRFRLSTTGQPTEPSRQRVHRGWIGGLLLLLSAISVRGAEIDQIVRKSDGRTIGGEFKSVSKTEVIVFQRVGNREDAVPANDIALIEFKGEPAGLISARSNERTGNLSQALDGYQQVLAEITRTELKGEVEFLIARTAVAVAKADPTQAGAALAKLQAFVGNYRDHYRFFPAQLLLGELALATDDAAAAEAAFSLLTTSPWTDYKLAGRNGQGFSQLLRNNVSAARQIFDEVARTTTSTPEETARKLEGMIGQATCLQLENDLPGALQILQQVVEQARAEDTRILAMAYLKQGDCYAADPQQLKAAVLAYLHVDVIPSLAAHGDLHAEALYQLSRLWPAINQPGRGAEATARLEQEYPASEWAKKLAQ